MPLLLIDLDNTLLDRAAAFRRWAERFVAQCGADEPDEVDWLVAADADGYEPRTRLAERVTDRYRLDSTARAALSEDLRWGMAEDMVLDTSLASALASAREAEWRLAVVTNGTVEQQERKLAVTGLEHLVDGWAISEAAGIKKPDTRLFKMAAASVSAPLAGAWVIGDSPKADIGGAAGLALDSVWISRGRQWEESAFAPTAVMFGCADAIDYVIGRH